MFFKTYFSAVMDPKYRIVMASAALSYYLIMSFFPLLIILYALLGSNYETAMNITKYFETIVSSGTIEYIRNFLAYVSGNYSKVLTLVAFSSILVSASAALRSVQTMIGVMQGGSRYKGASFLITSVFLSILFVFLIYVAIILLFFSRNIVELINRYLTFVQLENYWFYLRFLFLFLIAFFIIFFVFLFSRRMDVSYGIFWGALLSTSAIVGICYVFSLFISKSAKYSLVYSSLSSVILLMFWMYCCSYAVYCGALFNVTLARKKLGVMGYEAAGISS